MLTRFSIIAALIVSLTVGSLHAQESASLELLRRVPNELGLCLVIHDLRGQIERWRATSWAHKLETNPLVQAMLSSPEFRDLGRFEAEMKRHLDLDFATLRDEILGDAVVFAYQAPTPGQAAGERGVLLLKARKVEFLTQLIEKVNTLQTNLGELTAVEERKHNGQKYHRRVHQRATHYYAQQGAILMIASDEELLRSVLDRKPDAESPRADHWVRAGATKATVSLWLNPRAFDTEILERTGKKLGPEGMLIQELQSFWKGMDGILVSLHGDDAPELRMTLFGRAGGEFPFKATAKSPINVSELWTRFPENALFASAGRIDFSKALKQLLELAPKQDRQALENVFSKNIGAATGLDFIGEILPNIGPDLGLCVFPPSEGKLPTALIALAAKSAPKESPVDQLLFKSAQLFIGLAVFEYNRKNTDPIRVSSVQQGVVEIKHLTQDKVFPAGFQPALALKDGYLVLASSPEAIAKFRPGNSPAPTGAEVPLVRISPVELAKVMKARREGILDHLVRKGNESPASAALAVDGLAAALELFQSLHLNQRTGTDQAAWIVRLVPGKN